MEQMIEILNGHENNLKNVNVSIPKNQITVFTGVSGSGKSSLVFDTIAQEAGRQLNETYNAYTRKFLPRFQRPKVDEIKNLSTAIVIDQKRLGGNSRSTLGTITDINPLLRLLFSRFSTPHIGYANAFSFNDPEGMCATCEGIGEVIGMNIEAAINPELSINDGAILLPGFGIGTYYWKLYAETGLFDADKLVKDFSEEEYELLVYAQPFKPEQLKEKFDFAVTYEGLATRFMRQNVQVDKEMTKANMAKMMQFATKCACPVCRGKRYNETTLSAKISGYSIYDLTAMQLDELGIIVQTLAVPQEAQAIIHDLGNRIQQLCDIGLGYLSLNRETPTLSGGESQRVKMVKHLTSSLTGLLYIFDEPSTGLHPHDVHRLNELLRQLRDKGNTVLVVEHDPDVIVAADYVVDIGPKAGPAGGNVMFAGPFSEFVTSNTLTAQCLNNQKTLNTTPKLATDFYTSRKSSYHNLKDVQLCVPKGICTAITGVAGSGKSSLVHGVFAKDYPDAILIDQTPLHATSRSNPATYLGVMDAIRKAFADKNDVNKGLFSANSQGACPTCKGKGSIELSMSFMDPVEVVCSSCQGDRFKAEVLAYHYEQKNIVEIMEMTIAQATDFFHDATIKRKLKSVISVGLGYLTLGQPMDTLSGGECQRLKLAKELSAKGNIYILDEPTTGLHMSDVKTILTIIDQLVAKGNTVLVIEHNLDVIRHSDWIVDIGPYGGISGGQIMYTGPSNQIQDVSESITGRYL